MVSVDDDTPSNLFVFLGDPDTIASKIRKAKKNGGGRPQALAQWRARISAAIDAGSGRPSFSGASATLPSLI